MKVSIITCSFNSEPYISDCIRSVVGQSYPNIEHVFVDGGSIDGTLERIKELSGNVKWVTNVRGGISNAMNVGVELATGDIIAHLHADDYYLDSFVVEKIVNEFKASETRWVFGRIKSDIDGSLVEPTWGMPQYSYARLLRGNFIGHPAVFIQRDLFLSLMGFDCDLKYAMDYDFWLKLGRVSNPVYLELWTTAFRRHTGSVSTANPIAALKEDYFVRKRYLDPGVVNKLFHLLRFWKRLTYSFVGRLGY